MTKLSKNKNLIKLITDLIFIIGRHGVKSQVVFSIKLKTWIWHKIITILHLVLPKTKIRTTHSKFWIRNRESYRYRNIDLVSTLPQKLNNLILLLFKTSRLPRPERNNLLLILKWIDGPLANSGTTKLIHLYQRAHRTSLSKHLRTMTTHGNSSHRVKAGKGSKFKLELVPRSLRKSSHGTPRCVSLTFPSLAIRPRTVIGCEHLQFKAWIQ